MNTNNVINTLKLKPCRVALVVSVSASHTVGLKFASRAGHAKDYHKNGTNCLHGTQWVRVGVWQWSQTVLKAG